MTGLRYPTAARGVYLRSGEPAMAMPLAMISQRHEYALTVALVLNRPQFGQVYLGLQPDYVLAMGPGSGVYVHPVVPTAMLAPGVTFPGDIDLLVIPYEGDELVLDRILAVEVKVIRATWAKQGKSPNGFGISQARGLLAMGFPYVAVAHLITSDESPSGARREMGLARSLGYDDRIQLEGPVRVDCLPMDLMARAFARLGALSPDTGLGLAAVYIDTAGLQAPKGRGMSYWHPDVRPAPPNPRPDLALLRRTAAFFEANPRAFLDIPRRDPP